MKDRKDWKTIIINWGPIALLVAALILILIKFDTISIFAGKLYFLLTPFWLALILFYIFDRPVRYLENVLRPFPFFQKGKRAVILPILIQYLLFLGAVALASFLIIPSFQTNLTEFFNNFQFYVRSLNQWTDKLIAFLQDKKMDPTVVSGLQQRLQEIGRSFTVHGLNFARGLVGSLVSVIGNLMISLILAVYLLLGKERIRRGIKRLIQALTPRHAKALTHILGLLDRTFSTFFYVQLSEALILGCLSFVVLSIFSIPYVVILSVLITVCALIPVIGAWAAVVLGALLMLLVEPRKCLLFLVVFIITQQFEGNVIYPRRLTHRFGIPALLVILAVLIGWGIGGVPVALFAVPLVSSFYHLLLEWVEKREKEQEHKGLEARKTAGDLPEGAGQDSPDNDTLTRNDLSSVMGSSDPNLAHGE